VTRAEARVLVVGLGGLGAPAALALAAAGIGTLGLVDDDPVDVTNLHRQILYGEAQVGQPKVRAAASALRAHAPATRCILHETRFLPENALELASAYDVVVEGSDNFATKFLTADACFLAGRPVAQAAAVRWVGTAFASARAGRPCYRCVFEDLPAGPAPNCAEAGVVGPVVGVVAAVLADLALGLVDGRAVGGTLVRFDGQTGRARRSVVGARRGCVLCGAAGQIRGLERQRYVAADPFAAACS
jgi:molybdopterin/thiamine biosynthesis adenylyltransferase